MRPGISIVADHRLCARVVIGVNEYGKKRFLVIEDGVRESTQSWREVLLKLKSRGMNIPELAIGDGAMGFWAALEEIYPETRQQRCWMHKTMNVLNCLPKSAQAKAKQALHAIWRAETKADAEKAFERMCCNFQKSARERLVGSTTLRLMRPTARTYRTEVCRLTDRVIPCSDVSRS